MITLIANPASRSGRGKRLWADWEGALLNQGVNYVLRTTTSIADCREQARRACRDSSIVVAVGGDGTINAVISGMMAGRAERARAGSGRPFPPLGVLYAGTSPDFCRFHGIPTSPREAVRALLAAKARAVDIASISFTGSGEKADAEYFACGCNIGLGSATAVFANSWRKYFGDGLGTGLGLIRAMVRHKPFACRLTTDGTIKDFAHANHVMILKNPHIASGLRVDLDLAADDGSLVAVVVHGHSRSGLLSLLPRLYSGKLEGREGIYLQRCSSARVETDWPQPVEFDGDAHGAGPVSIRILPNALELLC